MIGDHDDLREQITEILVQRHSNGLCSTAGPCEFCDCFDSAHVYERDDTEAVMQVCREYVRRLAGE